MTIWGFQARLVPSQFISAGGVVTYPDYRASDPPWTTHLWLAVTSPV